MKRNAIFPVVLCFVPCLLVGSAANASVYKFIRADGGRGLVLNEITKRFDFTDRDFKPSTSERFGGELVNCSSEMFNCVELSPVVISVPKSGDVPSQWECRGAKFQVISEIEVDARRTWFVRGVNALGNEVFFSYSNERGVGSISFAPKDRGLDTYLFTDGPGFFKKSDK